MNFFERNNLKRPKGFSDEEIDRFVQHLRDNNRTIDSEEEARQFLKFQSNLDPSEVKKEIKLDERLVFSRGTPLYNLWAEFPQYHKGKEFNPLENMLENIIIAHDILKKNFYKINENEKFDEFDENQQDICDFLNELNERCAVILKSLDSAYTIESSDVNDKFNELMQSMTDDKLTAMGGFADKNELEAVMRAYLAESQSQQEQYEAQEEELPDVPKDAEIILRFSKNKVRAWLFILPPRNGGHEITEEAIMQTLKNNNIIYGVNKFLIKSIKQNQLYFKVLEIAKGFDPANGANGHVKELFSREQYAVDIREDSHGNVNYKEMNVIKNIHKGEVIAEIVLPTKATDGIQVTGEIVKGIDGKYPNVPAGHNTSITEDRTKLVAEIDGEVFFENDKFNVRNALVINHDIDSSIGNINFSGDIIINGNVREGFTVICEGNMVINGYIESAVIKATGNLTISKGMFGGTSGTIDVGGFIKCQYLEHCDVKAKGYIEANQILGCNVYSESEIIVRSYNAKIVGGTIFAGKGINASLIGTDSFTASNTDITVGMKSVFIKQQIKLRNEIKQIDESIFKLKQNISYLERFGESINDLQKSILNKLVFQLNMRNFQKNNIEANVKKIQDKIDESEGKCQIICDTMNPPVSLNYNGYKCNIKQVVQNCRVHQVGKSIYITGKNFNQQIAVE